jgi:hypothetical protein
MGQVRLVFDTFPAEVRTPDRIYRDVRAALMEDGTLQVWATNTGEPNAGPGPHRVLVASASARSGRLSPGVALQTEFGEVTVKSQNGCGCGNPLRSWDPFPGQTRVVVGLG